MHGGHGNPDQLENATKSSGGTVFCLFISLGINSLPRSCDTSYIVHRSGVNTVKVTCIVPGQNVLKKDKR